MSYNVKQHQGSTSPFHDLKEFLQDSHKNQIFHPIKLKKLFSICSLDIVVPTIANKRKKYAKNKLSPLLNTSHASQ